MNNDMAAYKRLRENRIVAKRVMAITEPKVDDYPKTEVKKEEAKMKKTVVFSRNGKVNHKFLDALETNEEGNVGVENVVHCTWDNGEAFLSLEDKMYKAVQYCVANNDDVDLIMDLVKKLTKICKAKNPDEFFFAAMPGFKMGRVSTDSKEAADKMAESLPNVLGDFDKNINQVDKMFNDCKTVVQSMVDGNTGKLHKF